jgi:transposase-like protein
VRAFCRQHGLAEPSFYAWRRKLGQREADAVPFVPVRVVPEAATGRGANDSGGAVELVLGEGRLLRLAPGFDAVTLQRLLTVLEEGRPC